MVFLIPQSKKDWVVFVLCMIVALIAGIYVCKNESDFDPTLLFVVIVMGGWYLLYPVCLLVIWILTTIINSAGKVTKKVVEKANHPATDNRCQRRNDYEEPSVKLEYSVFPAKGSSYVVDENGEPLKTYYRPNSGLFCSSPSWDNDPPFFLNIRRPVVFDAKDKTEINIPADLPSECDGIIFKNYGKKMITAFYVRDKNTQSMRV